MSVGDKTVGMGMTAGVGAGRSRLVVPGASTIRCISAGVPGGPSDERLLG